MPLPQGQINDLIDGSTEGLNNVFLGDSAGISVVDAAYNTELINSRQSISTLLITLIMVTIKQALTIQQLVLAHKKTQLEYTIHR